MLERLTRCEYFCFLDGYSSYNQISFALEDQEKATFTCQTFAYRRMSFGLCNVPVTFQYCIVSIFSDMVERFLEIFMDDFVDTFFWSVYLVLVRCREKNVTFNWVKCHFMIKEDIVLGRHFEEMDRG